MSKRSDDVVLQGYRLCICNCHVVYAFQTEPGMFCLGKEMGNPILPVPSDFSAVIERVNTHDKQVTYETVRGAGC